MWPLNRETLNTGLIVYMSGKRMQSFVLNARPKRAYEAKFPSDLKQAFVQLNRHSGPNTALNEWNKIFLLIANINVPVRFRKVRSDRTPWMTNEVRKQSFHKDYAKKKAVMLNSPAFHTSYKKCRNQVTKLFNDAKTQYFKNQH